jgi:hypothetical protein
LVCPPRKHTRRFPWLDAPDGEALTRALFALRAAGALAPRAPHTDATASSVLELTLTPLGAALAALPCDVAPGKLLLHAALFGVLPAGAALAAALCVASPLARPGNGNGGASSGDAAARALRAACTSPSGDALTLLALFAAWAAARCGRAPPAGGAPRGHGHNGGAAFDGRRWCRSRGLEEPRLVEMAKLQRQLTAAVTAARLQRANSDDDDDSSDGDADADADADAARGHASRARAADTSARRGARRELRALQRRREAAHGAGVLRLRDDGFAAEAEDEDDDHGGDGDNDGGDGGGFDANACGGGAGADAARLRELELSLGADLSAAAGAAGDANGHGGGARSGALLQALLALSLYPNVALPDARNAARREGDARFATRGAADVALHPSSVLAFSSSSQEGPPGAAAATAAPEAHVYVYGELLDTHRPFILNVTRLPAAALLLAGAARVEADASGACALVDGWALLRFATAAHGAAALTTAAALRDDIGALLAAALRRAARRAGAAPAAEHSAAAADGAAADADASLQPWAAAILASASSSSHARARRPSASDVASRLSSFLAAPPPCVAAALGNPAAVAAQRAPDGAGVAVRPWLRVGALREEASHVAALAATPHMRAHWACAGCGAAMVATAAEIEAHAASCVAARAGEGAAEPAAAHFAAEKGSTSSGEEEEEAGGAEGAAAAPGARRFECAACGGRALWLTPLAWMRHRAAHAAAPPAAADRTFA